MYRRLVLLVALCLATMAPGIYNDPPRGGMDFLHNPKPKSFTVEQIIIARIAQDFGINLYG